MVPLQSKPVLSDEDKQQFIEKGYVRLEQCFTKEHADWMLKDMWVRLGIDKKDESTWGKRDKMNLPFHRTWPIKSASPKLFNAICELLGDEDRIDPTGTQLEDNLIVNLGFEKYRSGWVEPKDMDNWHVDGDYFLHFLDSPEQALTVVCIWTEEVKSHGGATFISTDSLPHSCKILADHPEGLLPPDFHYLDLVKKCNEFMECTGKCGDVYILHPLLLHSASRNSLGIVRVITNPRVSLKDPFCFNRPDGDYSVVEKATLNAMGVSSLDFKIAKPRESIFSKRLVTWERVRMLELERLAAHEQMKKLQLSEETATLKPSPVVA